MNYLYAIPGAFFAPLIHEWVKALCSARLGDPTPKAKGFLNGNPLKYFEPVGFLLMLIVGFGWGQPVPTTALYYKDRQKGVLITYITPSVVNLLVGLASASVVRLLGGLPVTGGAVDDVLRVLIDVTTQFSVLNIGLAFFNLIPVHPLDCAKVLPLFLKPPAIAAMSRYEKILQVFLLLLLFMGLPQRYLFDPLIDLVFRVPFLF